MKSIIIIVCIRLRDRIGWDWVCNTQSGLQQVDKVGRKNDLFDYKRQLHDEYPNTPPPSLTFLARAFYTVHQLFTIHRTTKQ